MGRGAPFLLGTLSPFSTGGRWKGGDHGSPGEHTKLAKFLSEDPRHQAKRKKSKSEKNKNVKKVKEPKARSETFRLFETF